MDGIIIVNKEKEWTSHDVVAKVKGITKSKVGHTGTLDPLATGVLPLLLGKGTKLSKYLIEHDKVYDVELKLGIKTDTLDAEGKILERQDVSIDKLDKTIVNEKLKLFIGEQIQTPPKYSAIKVNGKKMYEYARENKEVEIPKRKIKIYDIKLLNINLKDKLINFRVYCSKGTYIRTLCEDIANKLGTIGYMSELNRIAVGKFNIENSINIKQLEENIKDEEFLNKYFISIEKFFEENESLTLDNVTLQMFLNGVKLERKEKDGMYKIISNNKFIGIGNIQNGKLKRELILD